VDTLIGQRTLVASWRALAHLSPGAGVTDNGRAVVALFPSWAPLNNAVLLTPVSRDIAGAAAAEVTSVYLAAGVPTWALWLPSSLTDLDAPDRVSVVDGLTRDTTTLVMTRALEPSLPLHPAVVRTSIESSGRATDEPVSASALSKPDGVPGLEGWALVHDGAAVAGAWSYLDGSDCGVYAVGTAPGWRRRGLAAALVRHVLAEAWRHGARTASLQSTRMGRPLYESLGFTAVGRYDEWVPGPATSDAVVKEDSHGQHSHQ
jgi:GNAT superfamily N-acetyltransferase